MDLTSTTTIAIAQKRREYCETDGPPVTRRNASPASFWRGFARLPKILANEPIPWKMEDSCFQQS
jgi:hypothetical protein